MSSDTVLNDDQFIDKGSPVPYYHQLKRYIVGKIEAEEWQSLQKLPPESEFCEHFSISRTVVRQAIKELQNEGYLTTEKGKGTFIAKPKIIGGLVQNLTGFYEDMVKRGFSVTTDVLKQEMTPATKKIAQELQVGVNVPVIVLSRLRKLNNEPSVFVTTYIPHELCPGLLQDDLKNKSLYGWLEERCGLTMYRGHRYIGVSLANEYEASVLNIEMGSPLIELESTSYLRNGNPLEYFHALYRGDRTKFEVDLVRLKSMKSVNY